MISLTALCTAGILVLSFAFAPPMAYAEASQCRVGFDVGSSGIRAGTSSSDQTAKVKIDYLKDVWADNRIDETLLPTVEALRTLPKSLHVHTCGGVAGGYSAWRYALERGDPAYIASTIKEIHRQSGVFFFVIPQDIEGSYGYRAAQRLLGDRLATPLVMDIGGGSIQFAAEDRGWGTALGQRAWRKRFCETIKNVPVSTCSTNPVGASALGLSRENLALEASSARTALGKEITVTAVSTPVVKAMHPILKYLSEQKIISGQVNEKGFDRVALTNAIQLLSERDEAGIFQILNNCQDIGIRSLCNSEFASNFVTDMLLVMVFMEALEINRMEVIEAEITNITGILEDERANQWSERYDCYLQLLEKHGVEAFRIQPTQCQ
ncbi:MAG: hypothetical protein HQL55_17845 [Magnetococcales bacterium]|nr:hypothetical protein [Magnetococcales bacterium]